MSTGQTLTPSDAVTFSRGQIEELRSIIHDQAQPLGNRLEMVSARFFLMLKGAGWEPTPTPGNTAPKRWYVGSMNDGCFIIDQSPRPSHDSPDHDANVNCITGFPLNDDATVAAAQRICDAHNEAIATSPIAKPAYRIPPLNETVEEILGRPNFTCAHIARILRIGGAFIAPKAEAEQAAVIHFLLSQYIEHADDWFGKANDALRDMEKWGAARKSEPA